MNDQALSPDMPQYIEAFLRDRLEFEPDEMVPGHYYSRIVYMSGGPGWCGTIHTIAWDGSPDIITIVGENDDGTLVIIYDLAEGDVRHHWN